MSMYYTKLTEKSHFDFLGSQIKTLKNDLTAFSHWKINPRLAERVAIPINFKPENESQILVLEFDVTYDENDEWYSQRVNFDAHWGLFRHGINNTTGYMLDADHFKKDESHFLIAPSAPKIKKDNVRFVVLDTSGKIGNPAGTTVLSAIRYFPKLLEIAPDIIRIPAYQIKPGIHDNYANCITNLTIGYGDISGFGGKQVVVRCLPECEGNRGWKVRELLQTEY